ncbi:DNA polymerase zeta catalytic subunit isoform X2 [Neocloeon triangulifer]|uniref:DNA polymerase zeta catalytic subunit isoform X2 n=1 Tax=Neocloeon triangulifer TaxID=2078957 RepID=UPI00286F455B|nr:DNA polymerase zeta catalytic subunit isoform X2 [Neocloeon triangulifer]
METSVRMTVCDFYLSPPKAGFDPLFSEFTGNAISQVPVMRVFGCSNTGVKACLHIHGVFPYLYVPFEGSDNPQQLQYLLANALDKALNISLGQANSAIRHIFKIVLVSGLPYYGYHEREHQFLKIYLCNPNLVKTVADLLQNGTILGRTFQPHEAHLSFTLQFMIDYNLQGMDLVNCAKVYPRRDPEAVVDRDQFLQLAKVSSCEFEADVLAEDIMNRLNNCSSQGVVNPGLTALWEDEHERRRIQGRETQPTPLATQKRKPAGPSTSEEFHRCRLFEKLATVGEDSISSTQSSVHYPVEAPEGLMNASYVEHHGSRQNTSATTNESNNSSLDLDASLNLMDTQDEELLFIFEALANSQIGEDVCANEEQNVQGDQGFDGDNDGDEDVQESLEMSQPLNSTLIAVSSEESDTDGGSIDIDIFEEYEGAKLPQQDGADDDGKMKTAPKRKRLGTRRTVPKSTSTVTNIGSDTLLLEKVGITPQIPKNALGPTEAEELAIPEVQIAMEKLEEREKSATSSDSVQTQESSGLMISVTKKQLGTAGNRNRTTFSVTFPEDAIINTETIEIGGRSGKLSLSFEMSEESDTRDHLHQSELDEAEPEEIKLKPCFVKLERLNASLLAEAQEVKEECTVRDTKSQEDQPQDEKYTSEEKRDVKMEDIDVNVKSDNEELYFSCGSSTSSQQTPNKRKHKLLSLSPNLSKEDQRLKRQRRKEFRSQLRDKSVSDLSLLMQSSQSKNSRGPEKKGPDKPSTSSFINESEDFSAMKSFYNLTVPPASILIEPKEPPPKTLELAEYGLQAIKFQPPFFSEPRDGNLPLSTAPCHLPPFNSGWYEPQIQGLQSNTKNLKRTVLIEPLLPPPKAIDLISTATVEREEPKVPEMQNLQQARAVVHDNHLKVMHLEILAASRGKLKADPEFDPICALYVLIHGDRGPFSSMGLIAIKSETCPPECLLSPEFQKQCGILEVVPSEEEAFSRLVKLVLSENPDILMGYEIEMDSWGYLVQRAARLGLNLPNIISRVPKTKTNEVRQMDMSQGAIVEYSDLKIPGRIVLNLWRIMRNEIALQNYSLESVTYHLLKQRIPQHPASLLLSWWSEVRRCFLVSNHLLTRLLASHRLLDNLDFLGRTSELAKLFGIQFSEVLSRGSQFRVESMMLRLAKPRNFVAVSPSITQKAMMKAPECIPLVMEPQSVFYEDPVAVLDFQSLYPSVIIAHNLCFSTCLGRVEHIGKEDPFEFGCTILKVDPRKVQKLQPFVSPNGVAFVSRDVRQGVLPAMLNEILETRLMVKQALKFNKKDEVLAKVLHARQLGLKLIANVTYGYTAANFSGRMPCIEVGDSVVSKGREILERAIRMVNPNQHIWGGEVVYGDTDSMFVLFRGKTREEAFDIAEQIAETVTADNPSPIKLKMEKVYQPCILQTKKRYVGFMYETKNQEEPVYEAKGIETVRRDGCPAVSKLLKQCLHILFTTKDLSQVKSHAINYFQRVLLGTVSMQDFIFAKEFRGFAGYRPGACVPALELARQWVRTDRRAEPRRNERVPYVIVSGAPGLPLIRLVRSPYQLLEDPALRLNADYYLTRALVPPLARCFNLLGVDVASWLAEMPRRTVVGPTGKGSIAHFFGSSECPLCRSQTRKGLCKECKKKPQRAAIQLGEIIRVRERARQAADTLCSSCCGRQFDLDCGSLACPVMYYRRRVMLDVGIESLRQSIRDLSF